MTYREHYGNDRTRTLKGDPRKEARRLRAQERERLHVCSDTCKRFRRVAYQ